ncbi:hypothetical protein D3C73_1007350 [compost metagenome]
MFLNARLDHLALRRHGGRVGAVRGLEGDTARGQPVQQGVGARPGQAGGRQFGSRGAGVGVGHCRVQLDQGQARLDMLSLAHMDGADDAALGRLDRTQSAGGDQPPLAHRHHVHVAEDRP